MSKDVLSELRLLLSGTGDASATGAPPLPQLFVGARRLTESPAALAALLAAPSELEAALHAAGALPRRADDVGAKCGECGGGGFKICDACRGSRKVRGAHQVAANALALPSLLCACAVASLFRASALLRRSADAEYHPAFINAACSPQWRGWRRARGVRQLQ
jgi:hypothetical protein